MTDQDITVASGDGSTAFSAALAGQDAVLPFAVSPLDLRGRAVQLGPSLDAMLARHNYPTPVARLVAEAAVLTVLLGTALKFQGKFILQTATNGPVSLLVADFRTPGSLRAYARFDADAVAALPANADAATLLGNGTLAMTIDQGEHMQRYQGIVQLDGIGLEEVARRYFRQSEQIPTEVRLGVGEVLTRREGDTPARSWTAGGVLLQFLPDNTERMRQRDLDGGDGATPDNREDDDAWREGVALMGTIEDAELTDAEIAPERLLYRLFHEHGVRAFEPVPVADDCSCSRDKVEQVLANLSAEEREASVEDGNITVTCEFCSTAYTFDPAEFR
ncbi:MAG: Hsp33 family molecular chaperone [Pseudomonadota bacterium]